MSVGEILHPYADLIGYFGTRVRPDAPQLQAGHSTRISPIAEDHYRYFIEGGDGEKHGTVVDLSNIRIASPTDLKILDTRSGESKRQETVWQTFTNNSDEPQTKSFSEEIGEVKSRENSFVEQFTIGMEATVGAGPESPVQASFKFSEQLQTTFGMTYGVQKSRTKTFSQQIIIAPRHKADVQGYREITEMEQDIEGYGHFTFDIGLNSWYHGGFGGRYHVHYSCQWTLEQFLKVVTGEVLPYNLSPEFQQHPLSAAEQAQLHAPLEGAKLKQTLHFENVDHEDVVVNQTPL